MKVFVYSEKGKEKNICEDVAMVDGNIISDSYFESIIDDACIVAIADGVGGNAGGDCASRYVLNELKNMPVYDISIENLKKNILDIDLRLLQFASTIPEKKNMATTMTGLLITSNKDYVFHIGNTRLYMMQGNYLKQITEDQTTYQWLLNLGQTDNAEVCNKNEIIYCLGAGDKKFADGIQVKECNGLRLCKRILLTTDGIHEYLSMDELEEFIIGEISKKVMQNLVEKASSKGSVDDKTIIVVDRM